MCFLPVHNPFFCLFGINDGKYNLINQFCGTLRGYVGKNPPDKNRHGFNSRWISIRNHQELRKTVELLLLI